MKNCCETFFRSVDSGLQNMQYEVPKTAVKPTRMLRSLDFCPVSGRSFHDLAKIHKRRVDLYTAISI